MHVWLRWLLERAWIALVACFALAAVWLATLRTVHVPSQELWYIVPLLEHGKDVGLLHPSVLSLQVMEHLIAVPMLLVVLPYALFGILPPLSASNLLYLNILNVGCSLATMALVLLLLRRMRPGWSALDFSFLASTALCIGLAPSQWELWTVPSIALTLATLLTVAAVALVTLRHLSSKTVLCAAVLCLLATYSFASGMLSWIVVLLCIACLPAPRRWKAGIIGLWVCAAAVACVFALSQLGPFPHRVAFSLPAYIGNTLALIAFPLAPHSRAQPSSYPVLVFLGAVVCVVAFLCLRDSFKRNRVLAVQTGSLFLFTVLQAVSIAVSRLQPLESRYLGLVFPGVIVLLALCIRTVSLRSNTAKAFLLSIMLACSVKSLQAARPIESRFTLLRHAQACLQTYDSATDSCLAPLFFGRADFVREYASMLDDLGFLGRLTPASDAHWDDSPQEQYGFLENVTRSGSLLTLWGWARERDCGAGHVVITDESLVLVAHTATVLRREGLHGGMLCGSRFGWVIDVDVTRFGARVQPRAWVYDQHARTFFRLRETEAYTAALRKLP